MLSKFLLRPSLTQIPKFNYSVIRMERRKQNIKLIVSLGIGYYIYRQFLKATMINKNVLMNQKQVKDLKKRNFTRHFINSFTQKTNMEIVIVIGAGLNGVIQAYKLLQNGYAVILLENNKIPNQIGTVDFINQKPFFTQQTFQYFQKNIFTDQSKISLNFFFEKYWFLWVVNSMIRNLFFKNQSNQQLIEKNLNEIKLLKGVNLQERRSQIVLFENQDEKEDYKKYLEKMNISYENHQAPQQLKQQYNHSLLIKEGYGMKSSSVINNFLIQCRKQYPHTFFEFYETMVNQFVLDPMNNVIGVQTIDGVILSNNIVVCASYQTKYIAELLGLRIPVIPLTEWVLNIQNNYQINDLITPKFGCINNVLTGEQEIRLDVKDSKEEELLEKYQSLTNQDLVEYEVNKIEKGLLPDDMGVISRVKGNNNVYLNFGHNYGFGAAAMIVEMIKQEKEWPQYSLDRYILI